MNKLLVALLFTFTTSIYSVEAQVIQDTFTFPQKSLYISRIHCVFQGH